MPGLATRALAAHDRREATGGCAVWSVLGSGGAKGTQEPLRAPQGTRREGKAIQISQE